MQCKTFLPDVGKSFGYVLLQILYLHIKEFQNAKRVFLLMVQNLLVQVLPKMWFLHIKELLVNVLAFYSEIQLFTENKKPSVQHASFPFFLILSISLSLAFSFSLYLTLFMDSLSLFNHATVRDSKLIHENSKSTQKTAYLILSVIGIINFVAVRKHVDY